MRTAAVRRDVLLRRVREGRVLARCDHRLTDDYLWDNANGFGKTSWLKTRVKSWVVDSPATEDTPERGHYDFVSGVVNFDESDFRTKSGGAYRVEGDEPGHVHIYVHSNLSYTLYVVGKGQDVDEALETLLSREEASRA